MRTNQASKGLHRQGQRGSFPALEEAGQKGGQLYFIAPPEEKERGESSKKTTQRDKRKKRRSFCFMRGE